MLVSVDLAWVCHCEPVYGSGVHERKNGSHKTARTSSKRSATQLPSPSTPSSQELPTKIAKLGLEHDDMDFSGEEDGFLTDPFPEESDWALSSRDNTPPTSLPSSSDCECLSDVEEISRECRLDEIGQRQAVQHLPLQLTPTSSTDPTLPLTLCTLPPELRHQIYLHLPDLVLPYPLIYCLSTFANKKQHPLASVSRLVRSEALAIFYSYNIWIIKLEFRMMYEAFQDWIICLGEGAGSLRLVNIAVRGSLFKPRTSHLQSNGAANGPMIPGVNANGQAGAVPVIEEYHPPDGDASFKIDLSEKWAGGKVELLRNDGTREAGEKARIYLAALVAGLWEKRRTGTLNGQDWVNMVDQFLTFVGWR